MDNIADVSEMHSSQRQPRVGGYLAVKLFDPKAATGDEMKALWDKLATQDYAFDDNTRGDPRAFVLNLMAPAAHHFLLGDSGYAVLRNVFPTSDCSIHFACWDRNVSFSSLIEAGKQILEWVFGEKQVNRITASIPKFNALAARFAVTMGFKYEGTIRKSVKSHGEYHDVDIYGLLHNEFKRRFQQ